MAPRSTGRSSSDTEGEPWVHGGVQVMHEEISGTDAIRLGIGLEQGGGGSPQLRAGDVSQDFAGQLEGDERGRQEMAVGTMEGKRDSARIEGSGRVSGKGEEGVGHAGGQVRMGTSGGKRRLDGKRLSRKPRLCIRQQGQPWMELGDTSWTCLQHGELRRSTRSFVSKWVLKQMEWEQAQEGDEVRLLVQIGDEVFECLAVVGGEATPSFMLGDDMIRELIQGGWSLDVDGWGREETAPLPPPRVEDHQLWFEGAADQGYTQGCGAGDDQVVERERGEFWDALIEQHTLLAVDGEEPGGLITGSEWAPLQHLLQPMGLLPEGVSQGPFPSGPRYATVDENPPKYRDKQQEFVPGHIHSKVEAWRSLRPQVDVEVMAWIEQGYEVKQHEAAMHLRCRNGKVARENMGAVRALFMKRVKEGSWEVVRGEDLINIIPINLAPKPGAEVPWRWLINGRPVNESYSKWRVRYEGLKTLPLVLKPGDWMVSIDLHSGYDALQLTQGSRALFGVRVVLTAQEVEELLQLGLLQAEQLGKVLADGSVEVFGQPVTLPQGFTLSCGIFTKLTRQLVRVWRSKGWRLAHLLDDLIFADQCKDRLIQKVEEVVALLQSLGFFVAWNKSILQPTQVIKWVGWVIDTLRFVVHVPGDKVEAYEQLVQQVVSAPDAQAVRTLARLAGKLISMNAAIPFARLLTRETYRCICPDNGWDATARVTPQMVAELMEVIQWLRPYNVRGAPIRRGAKMQSMRLMLDGSPHGFGVRVDGKLRDVQWSAGSLAVAADWVGPAVESQVYRELLAVEEVLKLPGILQKGSSVLLWTDCMATVRYVQKGAGESTVLSGIMKRIWYLCVDLELSVWSEHVPGTLLVTAGVDALSRMGEFVLAPVVFRDIMQDSRFGRRSGFAGCTVDLCASQKTKRLAKYCSRNQVGNDSWGDMRTVVLDPQEYYYVCPPWCMIEMILCRLEESHVAAVVVVPNFEAKAWHVWLRDAALAVKTLPWRAHPAVWLDVAEAKAKPHAMAQRFEFVVFALDFRLGIQTEAKGVQPVGRWKDQQAAPVARTRLQQGRHRLVRVPRQVIRYKHLRVLSLCGGMGTVGWCFKKVLKLLAMDLQVEVIEVEWNASARALASVMSGDLCRHHEVCDLWEWACDPNKCKDMLQALGRLDLVVCGFSCQDVSEANREGRGLRGAKSSVFFAVMTVLQMAKQVYKGVDHILECTDFEKKHPGDWAYVNEVTRTPAVKLDAGSVAGCWRNRAFWLTYTALPLVPRQVDPASLLEQGRTLLARWRNKLPTITTHPGSWNMARVVRDATGQVGPLTLQEVQRAMGYGGVPLEEAMVGDRRVTPQEVWRACGNAIHASVLCHVIVSWLVTAGYITRDDPRLQGQPWTVNKDGPQDWWDLLLQVSEKVTQQATQRVVPTVQVWREPTLSITMLPPKVKKVAGSKRALAVVAGERPLQQAQPPPTWAGVYDRCNGRGVPQLLTLKRQRGSRPSRVPGQEFWEYIDAVAVDLMILSRQDTTWKQYAAWFGVFEEFCEAMQVRWREAEVHTLSATLVRTLAVLFVEGGYAPKTLELYVTAVSSSLADRGLGQVRQDASVKRMLEGIKRLQGVSSNKKMPVEGIHIAGWMQMTGPNNDKVAWTGKHAKSQWEQFVAVAVLAWSCFLRVSEVVNLQVCDLVLQGTMEDPRCLEVTIRSAKADQRAVTTTTLMDAADTGSPVCLLKEFLKYVKQVHGGLQRQKGCIRTQHRSYQCMACAYVFPMISVRGVEPMKQVSDRLLRHRMKAAMMRLVEAGVIMLQNSSGFSIISFRRGGNSVSAAHGIRDKVRQMHGRWGLAGMVERGLTSEAEYSSQLARDGGAILAALNQDVGRHMRDVGGSSGSGAGSGTGTGTGDTLPLGEQDPESDYEDMYDDVVEQVIPVVQGGPVLDAAALRRQVQQQVADERWVQRHLNWLMYEVEPVRRIDCLYEVYEQWYGVLLQVSHSSFLTNDIIVVAMERLLQHFQVLLATVRKKPTWTPAWENYCRLVKREVFDQVQNCGLGIQTAVTRQFGLGGFGKAPKETRKRHATLTYGHLDGDTAGPMEKRGADGGGSRLLTLMALPCEFIRLIIIASTYVDVTNLWFGLDELGYMKQARSTKVVSQVCIPSSNINTYKRILHVCKQWYAIHKEIFAQLGDVIYIVD